MVDSHTRSEATGPAQPDPTLYPDVARAGSLQAALQREVDHAGYPMDVILPQAPGWRYVGARVEDNTGARHSNALTGIKERIFILDFWAQGVLMAQGKTTDLQAVVGAFRTWHLGSTVRDLSTAWPFVCFGELAEAHERGDAAQVKWRLLQTSTGSRLADLKELIDEAVKHPQLLALYASTSHEWLLFSTSTVPPYSRDLPSVRPVERGSYQVRQRDGHTYEATSAGKAIALILAALPPD